MNKKYQKYRVSHEREENRGMQMNISSPFY